VHCGGLPGAALETDTWKRLEAACVAHVPWLYPQSVKARVIELRDGYEQMFVDLIDDLPLAKNIDRRYARLSLIGALSWSLFWFKKEGDTPAAIARKMPLMFRGGIDPR